MRALLVAGTVFAALAQEASAQAGRTERNELAQLHRTVTEIVSQHLPSLAELQHRCRGDVICAGKIMAGLLAPHARLEQVPTPSTDVIRGAATSPSVEIKVGKKRRIVRLNRFGRDVMWELRAALQETGEDVVLDLRGNGGGDFDRMLRVAGLFCGEVANAVRVVERTGERWFSVPGGQEFRNRRLQVWIGKQTASSAEVLAALLKIHGNAILLGEPTFGKDVLLREVAIRHGWRLLVPAGRIEIGGVELSAGVIPHAGL